MRKLENFTLVLGYALRPAGRPEPAVHWPASARARKNSARYHLYFLFFFGPNPRETVGKTVYLLPT